MFNFKAYAPNLITGKSMLFYIHILTASVSSSNSGEELVSQRQSKPILHCRPL